jgi:EpsD family peptidyl-prolyl cis-trans isomerase
VLIRTLGNEPALTLLALALISSLAACSSQGDAGGDVAARVNSAEISLRQVNFVVSRSAAAAVSPERAAKVRRDVLERLVDQQLAVEQASERKLDRLPDVVMAIEAARREILARAYVEQLSAALGKPTADDARKYYAEHPSLFAERRVYSLQEIVVPASTSASELSASLRAMIGSGKSIEEIAQWLKSKDIRFVASSAARPAEQIPLELLPRVHDLKDGQGLVIDSPQQVTVMRLLASQSAPIPEAAALPRIQQFLGNQRAGEAAAQELKQLRAKATITYHGEFAGATAGVNAPAENTPTAGQARQ